MATTTIIQMPATSFPETIHAQEANHRIANQLTQLAGLVQIQARVLAGDDSVGDHGRLRDVLREVIAKIIGVAQLHRRLAEQPAEPEIELGNFLIESCGAILNVLSLSDHVSLTYQLAQRCVVPATVAQQIGLITGEVLMNAVKHAHPTGLRTEISIACCQSGEGLTVEIADDGVGLPESFDSDRDGTGLRIIRLIAKGMGADLRLRSDSLGLSFLLTLPAASKAA